MTHPIVGVMLNRCVIVDASSSLSCRCHSVAAPVSEVSRDTHGHFLLRDHHRGVLAAHRDGRVPRARDRFERILCTEDQLQAD